jgi:hypothetical protein
MLNLNHRHKLPTIIVLPMLIIFVASTSTIASPRDGAMLEKVYKLDAVVSSGQCPNNFEMVLHASNEDFGCDRVRIIYGYRSDAFVQCKTRKDLANRIIGEYNVFIDECESKSNNLE